MLSFDEPQETIHEQFLKAIETGAIHWNLSIKDDNITLTGTDKYEKFKIEFRPNPYEDEIIYYIDNKNVNLHIEFKRLDKDKTNINTKANSLKTTKQKLIIDYE